MVPLTGTSLGSHTLRKLMPQRCNERIGGVSLLLMRALTRTGRGSLTACMLLGETSPLARGGLVPARRGPPSLASLERRSRCKSGALGKGWAAACVPYLTACDKLAQPPIGSGEGSTARRLCACAASSALIRLRPSAIRGRAIIPTAWKGLPMSSTLVRGAAGEYCRRGQHRCGLQLAYVAPNTRTREHAHYLPYPCPSPNTPNTPTLASVLRHDLRNI